MKGSRVLSQPTWGRDYLGAGPHVLPKGTCKMQRLVRLCVVREPGPLLAPAAQALRHPFTFVSSLGIVLKSWRASEGDYPATRDKWVEFKFRCPP